MTNSHLYAVQMLNVAAIVEADTAKLGQMIQAAGDFRRFCEIKATSEDKSKLENILAVKAFIESGICNELLRMATLWMMSSDLIAKQKAAFGAIVEIDGETVVKTEPTPPTNNEPLDAMFKEFLTKLHKTEASKN